MLFHSSWHVTPPLSFPLLLPPIPPSDLSSLHAKFEVSSGPTVPAPVEAQFLCDGATLSGLDLELVGGGYHISLLKKKCSTGVGGCEDVRGWEGV